MPVFTKLQRLTIALASVVIGIAAIACIDGSAVTKDAAQNVRMGVNLAHHGVVSINRNEPYRASMYREPLPIAVDAIAVAVTDSLLGAAPYTEYLYGERVKIIKFQNVLWLLLLWAAALSATRWFTRSPNAAILAGLFAVLPFLSRSSIEAVNNLYTELPAAALLGWAATTLAVAASDRSGWKFAAAGLCFGLLALTKASFLYVFLGLVLLLACTFLRSPRDWRRHSLHAALLVAAFTAIVLPWIGRNVHAFGLAQISERGGLAIYTRALMNQLSRDEYRGTFYIWARPALQPLVGSLLGFTPADLGPGGRLERLNTDPGTEHYDRDLAAELAGKPEEAVTFYRRGRAERERLDAQYQREGAADSEVAADRALAKLGMDMVKSDFRDDLELTIPLLWRSATIMFPALVLALGFALWRRDDALLLYAFPGMAYLLFYALATPFEPRPASIARALTVVAVVAVIQSLCRSASFGSRASAK
jgi:4-amino-4-deoxy-L-arabinose transferase-like glycosyltransferase